MVRTCVKNARRNNFYESVYEFPRREKIRWKANKEMVGRVKNDLKKMDTRRLRKINRDRYAWKLILKESKGLHGPYSQR